MPLFGDLYALSVPVIPNYAVFFGFFFLTTGVDRSVMYAS